MQPTMVVQTPVTKKPALHMQAAVDGLMLKPDMHVWQMEVVMQEVQPGI